MKNRQGLWKLIASSAALTVAIGSLANLGNAPVTLDFNDKLVHFVTYFVLALLFAAAWRNKLLAFVLAFCLGACLEVIQSYTGYRYFEWLDLLANTLGAALGVAVLAFVQAQRLR